MRRRLLLGLGVIATLGAFVVALGDGGAAAKPGVTKFSCVGTAYNESYPSTSGFSLGIVKCTKPLGDGLQRSTFEESIVGGKLDANGTFKDFYDTGTVNGTYRLSGTLTSGRITATGPFDVTGGTGAFRQAKGKGRLTCATNDGGKTDVCTTKVTGTL